jgi:SulP family sulfate permease
MKKMGDLTKNNSKVGLVSKEKEFEINISEKSKENVFIKHLNGPLFFGFTSEFVSIANKIPKTASVIIIDMEKVPYIDQSGLFALEDVILDLDKKDIKIIMTGIQSQPIQLMKTIGILGELIPEERVFKSLADSKSFLIDQIK